MPDYRETIIRIDHDAKIAEVWTRSRAILSKLKRIGAKPLDKQIRGEWWQVGIRQISLRKPAKRGNSRGFGARKAIPETPAIKT
jgi:hypothetical protein